MEVFCSDDDDNNLLKYFHLVLLPKFRPTPTCEPDYRQTVCSLHSRLRTLPNPTGLSHHNSAVLCEVRTVRTVHSV